MSLPYPVRYPVTIAKTLISIIYGCPTFALHIVLFYPEPYPAIIVKTQYPAILLTITTFANKTCYVTRLE